MKPRYLTLLALMLVSLAPGLARAAEPRHPLEVKLEQCLKQNPSFYGQQICLDQNITEWAEMVDKYYRLLGGDQNPELKEAQAAWRAYSFKENFWSLKRYQKVFHETRELPKSLQKAHFEQMEVTKQRALKLLHDYQELQGKGE